MLDWNPNQIQMSFSQVNYESDEMTSSIFDDSTEQKDTENISITQQIHHQYDQIGNACH